MPDAGAVQTSVQSCLTGPALVLAAIIAALYWNSFGSGFHFDDQHAIEQNPALGSLANIPRFFVDPNTTSVLPENRDLRPVVFRTVSAVTAPVECRSGSLRWRSR